jgi:hypothetical protein
MLIRIRILPLTFFHIWTGPSNAPKRPSKAATFYSDADPTFQFDADPDPELTTEFFSRFGPPQCSKMTLYGFHLFTLMRIRILLFTLMRIHPDPQQDPQHW